MFELGCHRSHAAGGRSTCAGLPVHLRSEHNKGRNQYINIAIILDIGDIRAPKAQYDITLGCKNIGSNISQYYWAPILIEKHPQNFIFAFLLQDVDVKMGKIDVTMIKR